MISRDDVMSKNYYKERLDNVSHWSWKNVKYGHGIDSPQWDETAVLHFFENGYKFIPICYLN